MSTKKEKKKKKQKPHKKQRRENRTFSEIRNCFVKSVNLEEMRSVFYLQREMCLLAWRWECSQMTRLVDMFNQLQKVRVQHIQVQWNTVEGGRLEESEWKPPEMCLLFSVHWYHWENGSCYNSEDRLLGHMNSAVIRALCWLHVWNR